MEQKEKNIYYPPGGILIWIVVFIELITFSAFMLAYLSQRKIDIELYNASQSNLNATLGMINTIILLTSGLFMASGLVELKRNKIKKSELYLWITILLGVLFLGLKSYEYYGKFQLEVSLIGNDFFLFYWFLTGFHFLHVMVAVVLLSYMLFKVKSGEYSNSNFEDVETVGVFWHMCDLIWIFLFPILYLLH